MVMTIYFATINLIAFAVYGIDKYKAKEEKWRISEKTLIALAVFGGAFGAFVGMKVFHHKTRKRKFTVTVPVCVGVWALIWAVFFWQNHHLVVTEYEYIDDFDYTIVQISDLHGQYFGPKQYFLMNKIKKCNPDCIVVTGDVVDSYFTNYSTSLTFFREAVQIAPVYYVLGNHELRLKDDGLEEFLEELEGLGVNYLNGKAVALENVVIAGTKDYRHVEDYNWKNDERLHILLAHTPNRYEKYQEAGAEMVFAGHIHGGQVIIPGVGGIFSPGVKLLPELYEGEHRFGNMTLYISRGLGNSILPLRINNFPEIVVVRIHP